MRVSRNALVGLGMALIVVAVVLGVFEPLAALRRLVPLDPNEGWNALFEQVAVTGGVLYPPPGSLIVNNYPPLSFYIVGGLGLLVGDNILAGRWIALLSMSVVAMNIGLWLRSCGSARVAWLGAGLFAALSVTYARGYAGINDPQWLAHALMTTGLVVLWRGNAGARAIAVGALLIIAGGWTKHLLIPIPLAVTFWLLRRSRPALLTWVAWSALFMISIALWAWWMFGPAFFDSLHSARAYSRHQAIKETLRALKCFAPCIALSLVLIANIRRREKAEFAGVYFVLSLLVALASSGGVGVDMNAFFDLMIASSLCTALAVDTFWEARVPGALGGAMGPALAVALGLYVSAYAVALLPGALREHAQLDALEAQTRAATALIAERGHGLAACETPELCYWAGTPFRFDFFNYGQRLFVGQEPLSTCEAVFDGRTLPLLQIDPNKGGPGSFQLPASCNAVIERNFRVVLTSSLGSILEPKRDLAR